MARRKKYTVGLWMNLSSNLQIWSIQNKVIEKPNLKWYTIILAENDEQALKLAQQKFAEEIKQSEAA